MVRRFVPAGIVAALLWLSLPGAAQAQKLVYVVRHAERADGGSGSMQMRTDPPLSAAGEARAEKLAAMLGDAGIKAIFVTEYRRTQDTAKPLAATLGLEPRKISAGDTSDLVGRLRSEHAADIVFIVGHSNTVPAVIKALGGPDVTIADGEYDNLFILVPGTGTISRIRFAP